MLNVIDLRNDKLGSPQELFKLIIVVNFNYYVNIQLSLTFYSSRAEQSTWPVIWCD